jgi:Xaa-Pro aminopeptidase
MPRRTLPNRRSYPRFPAAEYDRRRQRVRKLLDARDLDALLVYADGGFETHGVAYLSNYRPSFATYLLVFTDPDEPSTLLVGLNNHLQYAAERAVVGDLRPLLPDPPGRVADRLAEAGATRIGVAGYDTRYDLSIPHGHGRSLAARHELVDVTVDYARVVATLSEAELARVRRAASALDAAMARLERTLEPGRTEGELVGALRDAGDDADVSTTFLSTAPMRGAEPGEPLPWKRQPADRTVANGDVVTTEVSASYRGYSAQIHRPYAVGEPPTEAYRELYGVVEAALEEMVAAVEPGATTAAVADAMTPILDSHCVGYDVALHGYGGWYGPPHVGDPDAAYWPGIDDPATERWTFEPGEVLAVQPNAVTADERHGLQLGTTVVVTEDGAESLQAYPRRFVDV